MGSEPVRVDVAVIGAGMAGLTCARRLQGAGYSVAVVEKSRGLGGRLATRRIESRVLDHGARFLQPQTPALQAWVDYLAAAQVLQPWHPQVFRLGKTGGLQRQDLQESQESQESRPPYWVAPAGMSAVGKALGAGLKIQRQWRVTAIAPETEGTWRITALETDRNTSVSLQSRALVLAIPAPQVLELVAPLVQQGLPTAAYETLAAVHYDPCITVMATYSAALVPLSPAEDSPLDARPWMVWGEADTDFAWVGLDSSKRANTGGMLGENVGGNRVMAPTAMATTVNVVLQSSATFATDWLEAPVLQAAGEALLHSAQTHLAPWLGRPQHWQVHRWRYALVREPLAASGSNVPWQVSQPLPLVACGDWCGSQSVDSALASGWQSAAAIAATLDGRPLPTLAELLG